MYVTNDRDLGNLAHPRRRSVWCDVNNLKSGGTILQSETDTIHAPNIHEISE